MSEQADIEPMFIVVSSYGTHNIAMRQPNGTYTPVAKMQMPYDNPAAAAKVCEALTVLDVRLKAVREKKKTAHKSSFAGISP